MKTIKIKDYYGKYQEIPVDDQLYEEWKAMQQEENRLHKREVYHCFAADLEAIDELAFATGIDDMIDGLIREEENRRLYGSLKNILQR